MGGLSEEAARSDACAHAPGNRVAAPSLAAPSDNSHNLHFIFIMNYLPRGALGQDNTSTLEQHCASLEFKKAVSLLKPSLKCS